MDSNMGHALSGLPLLNVGRYLNMTAWTDARLTTPTSNNINLAPTSNDSMNATPTSSIVETRRRRYKKKGGMSFEQKKGCKMGSIMYIPTEKNPCSKYKCNCCNLRNVGRYFQERQSDEARQGRLAKDLFSS